MILDPPAIYDFPYPGKTIVRRMGWDELERMCGRGALACTWPPYVPGQTCHTWMPLIGPGGVSARTHAVLARHENAHCNGWKH